mmetsp:Transcript_62932/g.99845  ORF Transcript_62932/g.99845 Transcript_62932/m.99845 type:complete len:210 (-) Transcript_62932:188-817(-)
MAVPAPSDREHQARFRCHGVGQQRLLLFGCVHHSLQEHRATIAVRSNQDNILHKFLNCASSLLIVAMFEKLLYNIVAIWMSGQRHHFCQKPLNDRERLLLRAMLQKALESSASILVPRKVADALGARLHDLINDELASAWLQSHNEALHHKVGMGAPDSLPNVAGKLTSNRFSLLICAAQFDGFLYCTASTLAERELPHVPCDLCPHEI